jgi:hypothetical protein
VRSQNYPQKNKSHSRRARLTGRTSGSNWLLHDRFQCAASCLVESLGENGPVASLSCAWQCGGQDAIVPKELVSTAADKKVPIPLVLR